MFDMFTISVQRVCMLTCYKIAEAVRNINRSVHVCS